MLSVFWNFAYLFTSTSNELRTKHVKKTLINAVLIFKMVSIVGALC